MIAAGSILVGCTPTTPTQPSPRPTHSSPENHSSTPKPEVTPDPPEVQKFPDTRFETAASFSQDFSRYKGETLSTKDWNILDGPAPANGEAEYYTPRADNLRIENGVLILEARAESYKGKDYTSARVDTRAKHDFKYGKFEITAKAPNGVGTWPAIWMMPTNDIYKGYPIPKNNNSPTYLNGEIDILEAIGSYPNVVYGIAHALKDPTVSDYPAKYYNTVTIPDMPDTFHTYGLAWTPQTLEFSVDGKVFYHVEKQPSDDYTRWPYDQPYHLILNLALGGSWAGREKDKFPPDGINKSILPAQMAIESINYFPIAS